MTSNSSSNKLMTAADQRVPQNDNFPVAEPTQKQPITARGPRNYLKSNNSPRFNNADVKSATRRGFERMLDRYSRRQNYLLQKDYSEEDRLRGFNFKRELAKRQKSPPRRIVDNHMLEKVVSRRRLQIAENHSEAGDAALPALTPPFSPRIPLPKETPKWCPTGLHVFYWA